MNNKESLSFKWVVKLPDAPTRLLVDLVMHVFFCL